MKKILSLFLLLLILLLSLTSCTEEQALKEVESAKLEFSKYYNGENEVALVFISNLYFEEYTIKLNAPYDAVIFLNNKMYYATLIPQEENSYRKDLVIYECDVDGNNEKTIFSKDLGNRRLYDIRVRPYKDNYYFFYTLDKIEYVDKYTISTGIYKNIASGEDLELSDFIPEENSPYNIEIFENEERGGFKLYNTETGETRVIDDSYLKNTIYIESMEKYNYSPRRFDISKGHILLTYSIGVGNDWYHSHLVLDYDFKNDSLEYKALLFPYEFFDIDIFYIGQ